MKILITLTFNAWALLVTPGCAIAQQLAMPAVPITVEAHVHDLEGSPVAHATVYLALPRYGYQENKGQKIEAQTNKEGVAIVSGTAQQDYAVSVEKSGYIGLKVRTAASTTKRVFRNTRSACRKSTWSFARFETQS